jgi:hypothetical protein
MKKIITIPFFLCFYLLSLSQTSDDAKSEKFVSVSEAYGYLKSQELGVSRVKKDFPKFEVSITKADLTFNLVFGKAKANIEKYLIEYFGYADFKTKFESNETAKLEELVKKQIYSDEKARGFISEINNRAKGNIESPYLETILSFQFLNNPEGEFLSGFTKKYNTNENVKALNTNWIIKVPRSWKAENSDQPNIIQVFASDFGDGNQSISLMLKDMHTTKGYKSTKEELDYIFSENTFKKVIPARSKFISFKNITINNSRAGMIEYEYTSESIDVKIKIRTVQFIFINNNKLFTIQGNVGLANPNEDLTFEMKKYFSLFKLVVNSIVIW